jgi:hypothetical protein
MKCCVEANPKEELSCKEVLKIQVGMSYNYGSQPHESG